MGKGETARYEQFLLFPQCFQKVCFQGASKGVIVWKWVKIRYHRSIKCIDQSKLAQSAQADMGRNFPTQQILDPTKLKEFAADDFRFDKNGRKFSKLVESIVGKGEIAHYEQFLLFSECFQKTCTADT